MLYWFLLYNEVSRVYIYIYIYIYPLHLEQGGLPTPAPQSHLSRSPQSTQLSSLHYTVGSH